MTALLAVALVVAVGLMRGGYAFPPKSARVLLPRRCNAPRQLRELGHPQVSDASRQERERALARAFLDHPFQAISRGLGREHADTPHPRTPVHGSFPEA